MGRLVMKFGGTSVADINRIRNVARHVLREVKAGHHVAVVVSAMAGTTDQLVGWCKEAAPVHDAREYDAIVASGEQGNAIARAWRLGTAKGAAGKVRHDLASAPMLLARDRLGGDEHVVVDRQSRTHGSLPMA